MQRYCSKTLAGRIYKIPSEWMTGGPGRSNYILKQLRERDTWRKKQRGNRGVYAPSHPSAAVRSASRAPPNSVSHGICGRQISLPDAGFPAIRRSEISEVQKDHSTKEKNGSSRLKKSCSLSTKRFFGSKQRTTSMRRLIGNSINSFITQASIHSGANDGVMYLG